MTETVRVYSPDMTSYTERPKTMSDNHVLTPLDLAALARQLGDDINVARGKWTIEHPQRYVSIGYVAVRGLDEHEITPKMKLRAEHKGVEIWH